ncbi:OsmC family protein, partial [Achromobacter xylosoxidans]
ALSMLAERAGLAIADASVTAIIAFGRDPVDGLFALSADINIHLPGVARAVAEELVRNTERLCPYAKMAQGGIECVVALTQ